MIWTFDDQNIGLTKDNRKVDVKVIPRPPGFASNSAWYEYALFVINNLNELKEKE